MTNYELELRQFIVENFLFGKEDAPLANGDSLLELGIIKTVPDINAIIDTRFLK